MRSMRRMLALLLCTVLLAGLLAGCGGKTEQAPEAAAVPEVTAVPEPAVTPEPDYAALYSQAAEKAAAAEDLIMTGSMKEERSIQGDTVREKNSFTARYQGRNTDSFQADVEQNIQVGNTRADYRETWADGVTYVQVKSSRYRAESTAEEFMATRLPETMFDPTLYGMITADATDKGLEIRFENPVKAEAWAAPETAELLSAAGTAVLSEEGTLLSERYEVSVRFVGVTVTTTYEAALEIPETLDLSDAVPADKETYTELKTPLAPIILMRARAALENVSALGRESYVTYVSQAAGSALVQNTNTYLYYDENGLLGKETMQISSYNGLTGKEEEHTLQYDMADGIVTVKADDEEEEQTPYNDQQVMSGMKKIFVDSLTAYDELAGAEISWEGDYLLLSFTGSDSYTEKIKTSVCDALDIYADKLDEIAEDYTTEKMEGFLGIDWFTWLPTVLNLDYKGIHTVEGNPYELTMQSNQAYSLYEPDIYEKITDEPLPDREDAETPTPVFYEVTSEDGGKMYLFGTIHVGDDRTGHLPQVILDAFDSADALAVEFDTDSFDDLIKDDEKLQKKLAEAYYYTDGSTIKDHLDEEILEGASDLMKVTGDYIPMAESMKPFVWSFSIDNFYLAQSRELMSSKGVDSQLLRMARESDKKILDVESGEFQIGMLSGYSDAVQEMMLSSSASATRSKYLSDLKELYEQWCTGDEATLIDLLTAESQEEQEEIDEEEMAVYVEYHQKMEVDRNAHMLKVAQGYLSGDETVFYAVGLAHLLGDGGLVQSLRDAGYTVTLVDTH